MIRIGILSLALAFSVIVAAAQAQQNAPRETTPAQTDSQGTAPGGMGSSGTSGSPVGKSNTHTTGSGAVANPSPANQPLMATGQDLKGPPTRFPANNTPE